MKTKTVFIPFVRLSSVAGAVVRGPWWCCGLVVMQPAYTTTPYTIHLKGGVAYSNSIYVPVPRTILPYCVQLLCTPYRVLDGGCILMLRTMLHRTRYQLQRAARTADTIVRVIAKKPGQFRYLYRHIQLFDVVEYSEIPKQNIGIRFSAIPGNTVKIP